MHERPEVHVGDAGVRAPVQDVLGVHDRFRIKIWSRTQGTVLYDNQRGAGDNAPLADGTLVRGGGIAITK